MTLVGATEIPFSSPFLSLIEEGPIMSQVFCVVESWPVEAPSLFHSQAVDTVSLPHAVPFLFADMILKL